MRSTVPARKSDYVANKIVQTCVGGGRKCYINLTCNSCLEILSVLCGQKDSTTNSACTLKDLVIHKEERDRKVNILNSQTKSK